MGRQYAVFHLQKGSGNGGGLGHHIDRTPGKEHTYPHVKGDRELNLDFTPKAYQGLSLPQSISKRLEEGYKGKRAIRKDAVRYVSAMLTGSHDKMREIAQNKNQFKAWIRANYDFVRETFGEDNIVRYTVHMDEKTPHIHCVFIPLTSDGRLSAKEIVGNKKNLEQLQDRYYEQMRLFDMERGIKHTGIKHQPISHYYRVKERIEKTIDSRLEKMHSKSFLGTNIGKTMENIKNELISNEINLESKHEHVEQMQNELNNLNRRISRVNLEKQQLKNQHRTKSNELQKKLKSQNNFIRNLLKDPELYSEKQETLKKIEREEALKAQQKSIRGKERGGFSL